MKLVIALLSLACTVASQAAVTLVNDAGPRNGSSFNSTWIGLAGYNLPSRAPGTNTVSFTASVIQQGSPLGSSVYDYKITVYDFNTSSNYSTTFVPSGTGNKITTISVPSNHSYNVTIWVSSNQLSDPANYWRCSLSNIKVTAPF